jgi:ribonuclease BN (tRNA processing enzyme)
MPATDIDAVLVSHGHPDHCADVNPLLRVRRFTDPQPPALPLYALPDALDAVLALDRQSMLGDAYELRTFAAGEELRVGPFEISTQLLPHPRPNAGFRISAGVALVYTGDAGPSADTVQLAQDADLFLAEASYAEEVPTDLRDSLCSAVDAGRQATEARVKALVLTHLIPGQDEGLAARAARSTFAGPVQVARAGAQLPIDR